jgi:hypothetical protein
LQNPDNASEYASDKDVLQAASFSCFNFDGGRAIPANLNPIMYGNPSPKDYSMSNPLTSVETLMSIHSLLVPETVVTRMKDPNRPMATGGPIEITEEIAKKMLEAFKEEADVWGTEEWKSGKGNVEFLVFSDDRGSLGTTARTMNQIIQSSIPFIIVFGLVTSFMSAAFFIYPSCVHSRALLIFVGACETILCFIGALGVSVLLGINLSLGHFWTLPFMAIGIGIDDLFMLALSERLASEDLDVAEAFPILLSEVGVPVTLTSLVNCSMFVIISIVSTLPGIYEVGYTGLIATGMMWMNVLFSYSALQYMDLTRRSAGRYECLPCMKSSSKGASPDRAYVSRRIYRAIAKPLMTTTIGRVVTAIVVLGILIPPVVSLIRSGLLVGILMEEFPEDGSMFAEWAEYQANVIGAWPVALNWGELDYTNVMVQQKMVKQFEDVIETRHIIGGVPSYLVWTAALALWGATQTSGACQATWVQNTLNLRVEEDGGMCRYPHPSMRHASECPVMAGLSKAQLKGCIDQWAAAEPSKYAVVGGGSNFIWSGDTLKWSMASGNQLIAKDLTNNDAYVDMIKETRNVIDKDDELMNTLPGRTWMNGIPYDFWDQYLDIVDLTVRMGVIAIFFELVVAFIFMFVEATVNNLGKMTERVVVSFTGAILIAVCAALSFVGVLGWCSLLSVPMSGFSCVSSLLSTGLTVEYAVHVVHRFMFSEPGPAVQRISETMDYLFSPNAMAAATSALSVALMGFSKNLFVRKYMFLPLAVAVVISYIIAGIGLPAFLSVLNCIPGVSSTLQKSKSSDKVNEGTNKVNEDTDPATPLGHEMPEVAI